MKTLIKSTESLGENMTKEATLFLSIFYWLLACSIVHGNIGLTVNGNNPVISPLELETRKSLELSVINSDSTETSYDLTLTGTGGVFSYKDPANKSSALSEFTQEETVNIQTFDLADIGNISFEFQSDSDAATISLTTNQSLTINAQTIPADTEIYRLILFDMDDNRVVVFGINYESLSYKPPIEEKPANQSLETSSLSMILPPVIEPNEPEPILIQSPADSNDLQQEPKEGSIDWAQSFNMLCSLGADPNVIEPNIIEINSDITTNQVWDANNVYCITDANGINVQALLVIEPGTTVILGQHCGLFVNNGGTLIAKGTPDKPIIFTPDWAYYSYPDHVGYYWETFLLEGPYYFCPIYIEETASSMTTVQYCTVEGAIAGIVTNNIRLDKPIENNYIAGNMWGVYEWGPQLTNIRNNLFFCQSEAAIEIYVCPDANETPDTENILTIEHNTCDAFQYYGIVIHGTAEPNIVPTCHLINNVITESWIYGLSFIDGSVSALVANTGYYHNYQNKNWDFVEYNPIVAETEPYNKHLIESPRWHHFLSDDSAFKDTGTKWIEQTDLIGTTTNYDSLPDKDIIDLGFHQIDWDYVGTEEVVGTDIDDLIEISDYWLAYSPFEPNSPGYIDPNLYIYDPNHPENWVDPNFVTFGGDWNSDGFVDLVDFALFACLWQKAQPLPQVASSIYVSSEDGSIEVHVHDANNLLDRCFLTIDGEFIKELASSGDVFDRTVYLPQLLTGPHEARVIAMKGRDVICPSPVPFEINSTIGPCVSPVVYEPNTPLTFFTLADSNSIHVSAHSWNGCVWQETFDSNVISGACTIPASITDVNEINYLQFQDNQSTSTIIAPVEPMSKDDDADIRALIVLPDFTLNRGNSGLINDYKELFENRGVPYKVLGFYSSSLKNLKKYAADHNIQYLIVNSHGYYKIKDGGNSYLRTVVELDDGKVLADKASNYTSSGSYAYLERMTDPLETMPTWKEIGFQDLRYAHFDCCYSGHLYINSAGQLVEGRPGQIGLFNMPHNDMSKALGLSSGDKLCFGWYKEFIGGYSSPYYQFSGNVIGTLEEGNNFPDSLDYAIRHSSGSGEQNPLDDFRVLGQGDNIQEFRIN